MAENNLHYLPTSPLLQKHKRAGHLFQNRYKSVVCEEDAYLLELLRYIHLNPLRAGLVKDLQELDKYPWAGHSAILGHCKNPLVPEVRDQMSEVSKQTAVPSEGLFVAGNQVPDSLLQQQKEPNPPAPLNLCSLFNWGVIREIRAKKTNVE
jgi:hypothetical protein